MATVTISYPTQNGVMKKPEPFTSSTSTPELTSTQRDPHSFPSFDSKTLTGPHEPILYLPPLLSKLPERFPSENLPLQNPPLVTETRLPDIDPASLSLHKALHHFKPLNSNYASTDYGEAFNWPELILPENERRDWYVVVFRSKRKAGSDSGPLYRADKLAHEEAIRNGGLIMYWYGVPDETTGVNLATCIWQSRQHAITANSRPCHIKAVRLAVDSYEMYNLERYILRKECGETRATIEQYIAGDVGW